jgi:hypothetical protein
MKKWVRRIYEQTALVAVRKVRTMALFWARQCRKSTTLGNMAFDVMSREPGQNVIAASASLLIGSELIQKAFSAAEQAEIVAKEAAAVRATLEQSASSEKLDFKVADRETGKVYTGMSGEDFADLYRRSRMELRLYFDRTSFSRLLVIAPNPATARGWTGWVFRDEAGFTPVQLEVDLQIAVGPIIDADPSFRLIYASNLPRDDRHPFFSMTLPPPDLEFPPTPEGHFYRGQNGILIHRVSIADAYAAGHTLYDQNSGKALSLEQFRKNPANKLALPVNYDLHHQFGGAAAIDLLALITAQQRGARQCVFVFVNEEADFQEGLRLLRDLLTDGPVGIGVDPASTTGETSNPTSVTVTENCGGERKQRLVIVWKEKREAVQRDRLQRIVLAVQERKSGGRARRMVIDGGNERLFAEGTQAELAPLIPVEVVVPSAGVDPLPAGYEHAINFKTWLGDMYSQAVNENRYTLPSNTYFKDDHRLPVKDQGRYQCIPEPDGKHGDTFDSGKNAEYALMSSRGAIESTQGIIVGNNQVRGASRGFGAHTPRRLS